MKPISTSCCVILIMTIHFLASGAGRDIAIRAGNEASRAISDQVVPKELRFAQHELLQKMLHRRAPNRSQQDLSTWKETRSKMSNQALTNAVDKGAGTKDHVEGAKFDQPKWDPFQMTYHGSNNTSYGRTQPDNEAAIWLQNLTPENQAKVNEIYYTMDQVNKNLFNLLLPEEQIDFMERQLAISSEGISVAKSTQDLLQNSSLNQLAEGAQQNSMSDESAQIESQQAPQFTAQKKGMLSQATAKPSNLLQYANFMKNNLHKNATKSVVDQPSLTDQAGLTAPITSNPADQLPGPIGRSAERRFARSNRSSSGQSLSKPSLQRSAGPKHDLSQRVQTEIKNQQPSLPRNELPLLTDSSAPTRISKDRVDSSGSSVTILEPQKLSPEEADGLVQGIMKPRIQMDELEHALRAQLIQDEQQVHADLQLQMRNMIQEVYEGSQRNAQREESTLRSQIESIQEEELARIHDQMKTGAMTMREAEILLEAYQDDLSRMTQELFEEQIRTFQAERDILLTQEQEQRIRQAEQQLLRDIEQKFNADLEALTIDEAGLRQQILDDHETSAQLLYNAMQYDLSQALLKQKNREEQERQRQAEKDQQSQERRRREQAQEQQKIAQEEELAREAAQKLYEHAVHEFDRLHAGVIILLKQLDEYRIKTTVAEQESRQLLLEMHELMIQSVNYQAIVAADQKEFEQKMYALFDREAKKIIAGIERQALKIKNETREFKAKTLREYFKIDRSESSRSEVYAQALRDQDLYNLILNTAKMQAILNASSKKHKKVIDAFKERIKQLEFLHDFQERIYEFIDESGHTFHPHSGHDDHDDDHDDDHRHDAKMHHHAHPYHHAGHDDHVPTHQSSDHDDPGTQNQNQLPTFHPPARHRSHDASSSNNAPEYIEEIVKENLAVIGQEVAQEMFNAQEFYVTPQSIEPWIRDNTKYEQLKRYEKTYYPGLEKKYAPYLRGYVQGVIEIKRHVDPA